MAGRAYNIGGGMENASSIQELLDVLEKELSLTLNVDPMEPRQSDQLVFVADTSKVQRDLGWRPSVDKSVGVARAIEWGRRQAH